MKKYMLDTNMIIYLIKQKPQSVMQHIMTFADDEQLVMSFVSYAELLKGVERSSKKEQALANLEQIIKQIQVVYPTDAKICHYYAQHFERLKQMGTPIGMNDLWIACHALAEQAILVTHNIREFNRITDLSVENWVE